MSFIIENCFIVGRCSPIENSFNCSLYLSYSCYTLSIIDHIIGYIVIKSNPIGSFSYNLNSMVVSLTNKMQVVLLSFPPLLKVVL